MPPTDDDREPDADDIRSETTGGAAGTADRTGDDETVDDLRTRDPEAPALGAIDDEERGGGPGDMPEPNEPA
jgi:hypothetical protein